MKYILTIAFLCTGITCFGGRHKHSHKAPKRAEVLKASSAYMDRMHKDQARANAKFDDKQKKQNAGTTTNTLNDTAHLAATILIAQIASL